MDDFSPLPCPCVLLMLRMNKIPFAQARRAGMDPAPNYEQKK